MYKRAVLFASEQYPYGSEFSFDTTGQEAVVVWLLHFANKTNGFAVDAKRTVDHILSYMRHLCFGSNPDTNPNGNPSKQSKLDPNSEVFAYLGIQWRLSLMGRPRQQRQVDGDIPTTLL